MTESALRWPTSALVVIAIPGLLLLTAGCGIPRSMPKSDRQRLITAQRPTPAAAPTVIVAPSPHPHPSLEESASASKVRMPVPFSTALPSAGLIAGPTTSVFQHETVQSSPVWPSVDALDSAVTTTPAAGPDGHGACEHPIDDYARVEINGESISARTNAMLETAQVIYGGPGDLLRVVQGSYTDDVTGSFGTHAGGGAVDISIRDPRQPEIRLFDEVDAMAHALRLAGFAAWYRAQDEVFSGSVPHIHAIAVGDRELSSAARDQLTGPAGYFRGLNGLPFAPPGTDRHRGPVICQWMAEMGYRDLRRD